MAFKCRSRFFYHTLIICMLGVHAIGANTIVSPTSTSSTASATTSGTATPLFLNSQDIALITGHKPLSEMDSIYTSMGKDTAYKDYLKELNSQQKIMFYNHLSYSDNETYRDELANAYIRPNTPIDVDMEDRPIMSIIGDINSSKIKISSTRSCHLS